MVATLSCFPGILNSLRGLATISSLPNCQNLLSGGWSRNVYFTELIVNGGAMKKSIILICSRECVWGTAHDEFIQSWPILLSDVCAVDEREKNE